MVIKKISSIVIMTALMGVSDSLCAQNDLGWASLEIKDMVWLEKKGVNLNTYDWSDEAVNQLILDAVNSRHKLLSTFEYSAYASGFGGVVAIGGLYGIISEMNSDQYNDKRMTAYITITVGGLFLHGAAFYYGLFMGAIHAVRAVDKVKKCKLLLDKG